VWTCPDDRTAGDKPQQNFFSGRKDVLDIFLREFDAACESGGLFQLTIHPHIITPHSHIWTLDEVICHAKAEGDVWFATHAEVAQFVKPTTASAAD
jgi:hypothetical protein